MIFILFFFLFFFQLMTVPTAVLCGGLSLRV